MAEELYTNKIIPHKTNILWGLIVLFFIGVIAGLTVFSLNKTYAADETCYWVGANSNWNEASNWSSLSGGDPGTNPCAGTSAKPDSGTAVIFDGGDVTDVTPEVDVSIFSLNIQSGYTGTFNNDTNDKNFTIGNSGDATSGDTTIATGGTINMGGNGTTTGVWTVWGNFNNASATTFNRNLSTVVMRGSNKNLITNDTTARSLRNITIFEGASINIPSESGDVIVIGNFIDNGTLSIASGERMLLYDTSAILVQSSTGIITGGGNFNLSTNSRISQKDGIINITNLNIYNNHTSSYPIIAATYESENVNIYNYSSTNYSFVPSAGTYTFEGDVTFKGNDGAAYSYTIDNSINNPNFVFKKGVTFTNGTLGTLVWTKGTGTITFNGTSAQSLNFLDKTVEDIRDSNTSETVTLTDGVVTDGLTVDASATFDIAGQDLQYVSSASTTNNGTIKLKGNETLTNVNDLDTNTGTVIYTGTNVAETLTLKNFAYNNLTITDANATKATFQPTNGSTLTVNGNFTLSSGTGTFDNATNDENITVTGDVTMDNTRVDMGDATWTVSGSFDWKDVGTFNRNASILVMDGDGKNITGGGTSKRLNILNIPDEGDTINIVNSTSIADGQIDGTLNLTASLFIYSSNIGLKITSTGRITGTSTMYIYSNGGISQQDGIIDVNNLGIMYNHDTSGATSIIPAEYKSPTVTVYNYTSTNYTWTPSAGTYVFNGNVTFKGNDDFANSYTVNNTSNPNFEFKGNVTFTNGTLGTLTWTKGTGTITFSGTGVQSANFLDKTVEDIVIANTGGTVSLTDGVTTDSLTVNSGATFDIAGQNLLYAAAGSITNNGTIKLQGGETLTNISGVSSNTGTVEYNGAGPDPYASLILGDNYNNLTISGTGSFTPAANVDCNGDFTQSNGTFVSPSTLTIGGDFNHSAGTFTHNSGTVVLDGSSQAITGTTTFSNLTKQTSSTDTLTFPASTTQTVSGTLTLNGASGNLLSLRSSIPGTQWSINPTNNPSPSFVDVQDSNNTSGTTIVAASSTNSGNNTGWSFPDRYSITSASQTNISIEPGQTFEATITREDATGNPDSGFSGNANITFSGANTSSNSWQPTATDNTGSAIQFGSPTSITFTSGVATTNITPYKSETASINVTDGTYSSVTPLTDTVSSPTGSISIQNPPSGYSNQTNIKLDLSITKTRGTDDSKVKLSTSENDIPFTGYATFSSPQDFSLPSSDGYKTVYAQFQDRYGNSTPIYSSQTINLDVTAPSQPSDMVISDASDIDSTTQKVYAAAMYFNPSSDSSSGLKGYKVVRDGTTLIEKDGITDNDQIQTINGSTTLTTGSSGSDVASFIDLTGESNTSYTYQISSVDNAGNVSNPSSATITLGTGKTSDTGVLTQITEFDVSFESNTNDNTITAIVTWATNAPATGTVYYGTSEGSLTELKDDSSSTSDSSSTQQNYNTGHTKTITGLTPATNYYFKATSTDQNGNSISTSKTTTSPNIEDQKSLFEIIWEKIENFFSLIWQAIKYIPTLIIKQFTAFEHAKTLENYANYSREKGYFAFLHAKTLENYANYSREKGYFAFLHAKTLENYANYSREKGYGDHYLSSETFANFRALSSVITGFIYNTTPHALAQISSNNDVQGLHVVSATNESNEYIGNAIYWQGEGSFTLTRDGTTLANTTTNSYLDLTAQENTDYTYSANNITGEKETALPGGTPQITQVSITEIAVTTESANIEISWLTDDVPSTSTVKYGTVKGSYSQTIEQETYNEDHSVIVSGLDPNQTYYFQVQSTSTDNITSTSEEVSYTVPEAQKAKSIFVIIYEALENAFGTFVAWLYR